MGYNTFNEVYFNNKSLDWYEKNTILLTKDTWRPLRRDDVVLCLFGARGDGNLKTYFKLARMSPYMKEAIAIYSNFRNMHYADEHKYTYNDYKFDLSEVAVNNNDEIIMEGPSGEEIINIYQMVVQKEDALYLIISPVKKFINYPQLPNTK